MRIRFRNREGLTILNNIMMTHSLSKLPIDELLQKFGAGGHKPGSGSAAALLGLEPV
jgi:hypothetical protein